MQGIVTNQFIYVPSAIPPHSTTWPTETVPQSVLVALWAQELCMTLQVHVCQEILPFFFHFFPDSFLTPDNHGAEKYFVRGCYNWTR